MIVITALNFKTNIDFGIPFANANFTAILPYIPPMVIQTPDADKRSTTASPLVYISSPTSPELDNANKEVKKNKSSHLISMVTS